MITKKYIKWQISLSFIICHLSVSVALTSCSDWDDHYVDMAESGAAGTTLWEQLKQNSQVSDFCEVLEQTKVFRMHKKTPVSYADLLNSGQSFTVLAPMNGTFNKDSLLKLVQTAQGDSAVEKIFIQNHIARSLTSVKPEETLMRLLNSKRVNIGGNKIGDVTVVQPNVQAKNGMLHILAKQLPYNYNLYEMLCHESTYNPLKLSEIGQILTYFDKYEFDADASVSSGIVEGVPVYVDSVVYERNRLLEHIGLLKDEDSTYMVVAPMAEGWKKAWNEALPYFNYAIDVEKRDSMQLYGTVCALLEDGIFNMNDQRNQSIEDSLVSVQYDPTNRTAYKSPVYNAFFKPTAAGGILSNAKKVDCYNGSLYRTDEWSFTPEQTYFKVLRTEAENEDLILKDKVSECKYFIRNSLGDSISRGKYLDIQPVDEVTDWEMTFRVDNNLSGTYEVCVVVLPKNITEMTDPEIDLLPCKFMVDINYVDKDGKKVTDNCDEMEFENEYPFEKVDTVKIKTIDFPVCNYGMNDERLTITIKSSVGIFEHNDYNTRMFLDCIYLRPIQNAKPKDDNE